MANTIKLHKDAERRLQIDLMMPSIAELALMKEEERELLLKILAKKIKALNKE